MSSIKLRTVSFKLPSYLLIELDKICSSLGISRSEAIRRALTEFINRYGVQPVRVVDKVKLE